MMLNLDSLLDGQSASDVVDAIYFALRYFKQASSRRTVEKDVFQDAPGNVPSPQIRVLADSIIHHIEQQIGKGAADLSELERKRVFVFLSDIAMNYEEDFSEADLDAAREVVAEFGR